LPIIVPTLARPRSTASGTSAKLPVTSSSPSSEAQQRAGQHAAHQQVERAQRGLGDAGLHHVADDLGGFQ
jgi:hypothetical protein